MITIKEALQILQKNLPSPRKENICFLEANRCYLADDILAPEPSPRYTNSAMDGYAVRWRDVKDATNENPVSLQIIGESKAGVPFGGSVGAGQSTRISTGAMMPKGTDTVFRIEDTEQSRDAVTIFAVKRQGQDVRYSGEEFQTGATLLTKGTLLQSKEMALLAATGVHTVSVFARPRISILITGSELAGIKDAGIKPYQIRDSNSIMLSQAVIEAGGQLLQCNHVEDNFKSTIDALDQACQDSPDLLFCTGGVSVGSHDYVKQAAEKTGFQQLFWRIRQKPGKPLYVGKKRKTLLFGLPGNPVSAYMCFVHYIRPIMATFNGQPFSWPVVSAAVVKNIENTGKRANLMRVAMQNKANEGYAIVTSEKQGSHMLTSLVNADGYIVLAPGERLKAGSRTDVYLLSSR